MVYPGEIGTIHSITYQWVDEGKGAYCAWCGIKREAIMNQELHMRTHTTVQLVDESKFKANT